MWIIRLFGRYLAYFGRKGVRDVAVIYATLIIKGNKTFADVPALIKADVRDLLIALDLGVLAE